MLERYEENFDPEEFLQGFMKKRNIQTKKGALALARKEIPLESYYQAKIKDALKKRYPGSFIRKISQGAYSEGGIPDILFVWKGHYFGFEVKRPVVGEPSKLQERTVELIRAAGGTAEFVVWPEDAIRVIEKALERMG